MKTGSGQEESEKAEKWKVRLKKPCKAEEWSVLQKEPFQRMSHSSSSLQNQK